MLKKLKLRWKILLILGVIIILYIGYRYIKYTPFTKRHPDHYIKIHGVVDPKLQSSFQFYVVYAAQNERCDQFSFEVGQMQRMFTYYFYPKFTNNNEYTARIPTDKYYPGLCGWTPRNVGFIIDGMPQQFQLFDTLPKPGNNHIAINANCQYNYDTYVCTMHANPKRLVQPINHFGRIQFKSYHDETMELNARITTQHKQEEY